MLSPVALTLELENLNSRYPPAYNGIVGSYSLI